MRPDPCSGKELSWRRPSDAPLAAPSASSTIVAATVTRAKPQQTSIRTPTDVARRRGRTRPTFRTSYDEAKRHEVWL